MKAKIVEKTSEGQKRIAKLEEELRRLNEELKLKQLLEDKVDFLNIKFEKFASDISLLRILVIFCFPETNLSIYFVLK